MGSGYRRRGFTGEYVAAELARAGYRTCGLVALDGSRVGLLDAEAVADAVMTILLQAVIDLAAISFVAHDDVDAIYRTNIVGTRNLLNALARLPTPPSTVVLASSAAVYGRGEESGGVLDERTVLKPANDYGVSKLAMEYMARARGSQLPVVITRPFNCTGAGQNPRFLIPKIVEHFRRGERVIELGNTEVWREFMDVRAVGWAYRRLLQTEGHGDTFNLCTGAAHSLRQVLAMMAQIAGYPIEVRVNPAFVRDNEIQRLQGDSTLLTQRVGPLPSYTLIATLRWMYAG